MEPYRILTVPDPTFWQTILEFPVRGNEYPQILTLDGKFTFSLAPFSCMKYYHDFGNPDRALCFTLPATPAPVSKVQYLLSPQNGAVRRVFAAFFWSDDQAILSECSYIPLLHRPLGLLVPNGTVLATTKNFQTAMHIIKGDEAPVNMVLQAKDPRISIVFRQHEVNTGNDPENPHKEAFLNIAVQLPDMACIAINGATGVPL